MNTFYEPPHQGVILLPKNNCKKIPFNPLKKMAGNVLIDITPNK